MSNGLDLIARIMADTLDSLNMVLPNGTVATLFIRSKTNPSGHLFMSKDTLEDVSQAMAELGADNYRNATASAPGGIEWTPERKN